MIGIIEHRSYQVIQPGIHSSENRGKCLFYNVHAGKEVTGLTHQELTRLKNQGQFTPVFLAEFFETFGKVPSQGIHIGEIIVGFISYFESAAEIDVYQVRKTPGHVEHDISPPKENFNIQD